MLRDIEKDVENKRNISVQTVIFIQRAKRRWVIMLRRSMLIQVQSSRQFVLFANKSSQVTTLSNNIEERNMEQNNGNRYCSGLEQDCGGRRKNGKKLKEEHRRDGKWET